MRLLSSFTGIARYYPGTCAFISIFGSQRAQKEIDSQYHIMTMSEVNGKCVLCGGETEVVKFDEDTTYVRSLSVFVDMIQCPSCGVKGAKCKLCKDTFSTFRHVIYVILLHYNNVHMSAHYYYNGYFDANVGGVYVQTHGMGFIFPQTLFIRSTTGNIFPPSESILDQHVHKTIDVISTLNGNTQILKNGVKCNYFNEYVISEVRKCTYYCIVCLVVYEDGLPPLDLVVNHIRSCAEFHYGRRGGKLVKL